jgi:PKD repeat protein
MKRIFYLTLILPLFLFSCESNPEASFFLETDIHEIGQEIIFRNTSQNASSYEWDFGDGYLSNEKHPVHYYQLTGTYEVVLTAISKKGVEDKAVMTLNIVEPSVLVIEVLEYYYAYPVADASVILYPSLADWDNQQNMIIEGFTGDDGIVVFANLDQIVHFVDVWEQNHDNYQLRIDDEGWIKTPKITPNKVQWFVAWVDYVEHKKGAVKGERTMVIRKLERKASDKAQPDAYSGAQDWQELYKRRVVKK